MSRRSSPPYAYLGLSTSLFVAWLILYGSRPEHYRNASCFCDAKGAEG